MKKITLLFCLAVFALVWGCQSENENLYLIETDYGDITIKLYNETPTHRDNFDKLVKEKFYKDLIFHRVIEHFMIQGGDPTSKEAPKDAMLGEKDAGYTLPAEIRDSLFHKKGVIAAAREGDQLNPEKRSSSSQFYLVQGKVFTNEELDNLESKINSSAKKSLIQEYIQKTSTEQMNKGEEIDYETIIPEAETYATHYMDSVGRYQIPDYKRVVYTTIGGTPHLDGNYTVFGEVVEGLEVIDKIAAVKTNKHDRPLEDVVMNIKKIK